MQLNWSPTSIDQGQLEGELEHPTMYSQGSCLPVSEPDWEKTTVGKRVTELVAAPPCSNPQACAERRARVTPVWSLT